MNADKLNTIDQLTDFLDGTQPIAFCLASNKAERYQWVQQNIAKFHYRDLNKVDKGIVMRYLMKVSGYSPAQLKRLIKQYRDTGHLRPQQRTVAGFTRRYTDVDIRLLAAMDERHDTPGGPMIKKLCERAYTVFAQPEYERLANISVAHLYNLRKSTPYTRLRQTFSKTKPRASHIAVRRKPQPNGQPGYIRIDSVHQGDLDRQKGVYHINAPMKSLSLKSSPRWRGSVNVISSLPWKHYLKSSPLWSSISILTTARNTSTSGSPSSCKSSSLSSPNPAHDKPMIMPWQKARMAQSCVRFLAIVISRNVGHRSSICLTNNTSPPTSIIIGLVSSPGPSRTARVSNVKNIATRI